MLHACPTFTFGINKWNKAHIDDFIKITNAVLQEFLAFTELQFNKCTFIILITSGQKQKLGNIHVNKLFLLWCVCLADNCFVSTNCTVVLPTVLRHLLQKSSHFLTLDNRTATQSRGHVLIKEDEPVSFVEAPERAVCLCALPPVFLEGGAGHTANIRLILHGQKCFV